MNRPAKICLSAGLILASGIAGYSLALPASVRLTDAFAPKWRSAERGAADARPRRVEDPIRDLARLLDQKVPRSEIWSIVSRIPASRMPEAIRLLKEAADRDGLDDWLWYEIASALYFHWAESDPQAAMADALTFAKDQRKLHFAVSGVLSAWMRVDADAAYRHVMENEDAGHIARDMYVRTWSAEDAFANAERYPAKRGDLLGWYAIQHIDDPARREAMLNALSGEHRDLKEKKWVYSLLYRSWGYNDFDAAMDSAAIVGLPWLEKQLLHDNLEGFKSHEVLQWATENGRTPAGPLWEKGYSNWLMIGPDQARQWFAEESPNWMREGRNDIVVGFLAKDFQYSSDRKDAAAEATLKTLSGHLENWQAADPAAASAWLAIAPDSVREGIARVRKGDVQ